MPEDGSEDSFDKVKKGLKKTAEGVKEGVEDTAEGVKEGVEDTAEGVKEGVEDTAEGVKEGVEDTAEGVKEGVEDTAEGVKEGVEDTAEGVKEGVEDTAEGVKEGVEDSTEGVKETARETTDKDTYTKSYEQTENREYNKAGGNDKAEDISKKTVENLRDAKENLRQKAAKIADEGTPSEIVKKTKAGALTILRKPIVIIIIIAAIALIVVLLYTQIHFNNQANKIENNKALWNQSLADLRSGNSTVREYCISPVHDEDFCNRLKSLEYM